MNGRKAKQIRKKSIGFLIDWLKIMLIEEEQKKVSVKNYKNYLPEETHIYANKKFMVHLTHQDGFKRKLNNF